MDWIQSVSSTLKTWAFKRRVLAFSDRFERDPQACFYCPEMCRFSCPAAETLRDDSVTPRAKMSLLHLEERGFSAEAVAGGDRARHWFLEQCTGCGRCTEFCLYEIDVASNLREARSQIGQKIEIGSTENLVGGLSRLRDEILICEPGRESWWRTGRGRALLAEIGAESVVELELPHVAWSWGKLPREATRSIGKALSGVKRIWMESPEAAWFLAKGVKEELKALRGEIRLVWQALFPRWARLELPPGVVFHESFHLARLFPRLGYSIPMHERGLQAFHAGWNAWDCGGEGFYKLAHAAVARDMGRRCLADLAKDGRTIERVVCQSLSCAAHLNGLGETGVSYWLDEL